ncbi:MAG: long-chain-fatty-acid--CoA ligase [Nitrospinae bacterium]|nr:long-chain-fatty-acid--CoA ligase [Nitrospinota bacterium]
MDLQQILERAVRFWGARNAAVCGTTRLTYQEVAERVRRLCGALHGLGIKKGDRLAVLMYNCHRYLELYYATAEMGALIVPLNIRLSGGEIAYILNDSASNTLFVSPEFLPLLSEIRDDLPCLQHGIVTGDAPPPAGWHDYEHLLATAESSFHTNPVLPEDLAGLFYTSGTTGYPKGVMLSHANLMANAYHILAGRLWQEGDVYLHACPMFHLADGPTSHAITWVGGTHVIIPGFKPDIALEVMERERVTVTLLIPTMVNFLINHPEVHTRDLRTLRNITYGGAPMPGELVRRAMQTLPCTFRQAYGLTETSPLLTVLPPEQHVLEGPPAQVRRMLSCGREVVGVRVRVVNEQGQEVQPGEVGEIIAKGPNIMVGYWNKPKETAEVLREGWLYTGDLATVDDEGYIYIVDRKKDMIITGGENVFSTEVENALYMHPAILEAAVVGVPDEKWGEAIKAIVMLKPGMLATEGEIVEHCRARIAHFKVPRSVDFFDDALPKSGSGKILKRELRERYWVSLGRRVH